MDHRVRVDGRVAMMLFCLVTGAACGSSGGTDRNSSGVDGGGNSCSCLVGGFDMKSGDGIVSRLDADSLRIEQEVVPLAGRPLVSAASGQGELVLDAEAGVIHVMDNSSGRPTIVVGEPLRGASYGYAPTPGPNTLSPVYAALADAPLVHRYLRGDEDTPAQAGTPLATADLSNFDEDGDPDVFAIDGRREGLLVVMGRRVAGEAVGRPALVALLDGETLELVESFELVGGSPSAKWGDLIATADGDEPGCLQKIELEGGARSECVVGNDVVGGTITAVSGVWPNRAWVTVLDVIGGKRRVLALEVLDDTVHIGQPVSRSSHDPSAVADCGKWVVYGDSNSGRVHVYDWRHDLWFTDEEGASIGQPVVPDQAFACQLAL